MLTVNGVKLTEVSAPTPYAHDEVGIVFRMRLGIQQNVAVDGVQLELMSSALNKVAHERRYLLFAILRAEYAVVKLHG